jgi:hypothetical protein
LRLAVSLAHPSRTKTILQVSGDGEIEVREEYRGKITFLDERKDRKSGEHLAIGIAFKESEGETH